MCEQSELRQNLEPRLHFFGGGGFGSEGGGFKDFLILFDTTGLVRKCNTLKKWMEKDTLKPLLKISGFLV